MWLRPGAELLKAAAQSRGAVLPRHKELLSRTYDLGVVGEGFGLAGLVVRLPLQLDEHRCRFLQVLVSILWRLKDDGELSAR